MRVNWLYCSYSRRCTAGVARLSTTPPPWRVACSNSPHAGQRRTLAIDCCSSWLCAVAGSAHTDRRQQPHYVPLNSLAAPLTHTNRLGYLYHGTRSGSRVIQVRHPSMLSLCSYSITAALTGYRAQGCRRNGNCSGRLRYRRHPCRRATQAGHDPVIRRRCVMIYVIVLLVATCRVMKFETCVHLVVDLCVFIQ